jgi:hypothetical protein
MLTLRRAREQWKWTSARPVFGSPLRRRRSEGRPCGSHRGNGRAAYAGWYRHSRARADSTPATRAGCPARRGLRNGRRSQGEISPARLDSEASRALPLTAPARPYKRRCGPRAVPGAAIIGAVDARVDGYLEVVWSGRRNGPGDDTRSCRAARALPPKKHEAELAAQTVPRRASSSRRISCMRVVVSGYSFTSTSAIKSAMTGIPTNSTRMPRMALGP